ncbi:MAG: N-acetyltransferase [Ignavibacteriaceae bacterium]|nr:N-acetyltransferase [Ignavibacteriaceae bacterium]
MEILHDEHQQKFYVITENLESHLHYVKLDNILDLNHTYVPYQLRGKGIAGKLVEAALEYAKQNGFKIIPSCSYVDVYFQRHPEYEYLLN